MEGGRSFFKFIVSPSGDVKRLMIPKAFTKEFGSTFLDYAYLTTPGGLQQKVALEQKGQYYFFTSGWQYFTEQYSIAFGYFLVFYYQGNSRFQVSIYDESACEIDYPNFDTASSNEEDEEDEQEDEKEEEEDEEEEEEEDEEVESIDKDLGKGKEVISAALERAEIFHCDHPSFVVSMNQSYLTNDYRMWVPSRHGQSYLNKESKKVQLQVGGGPNGRTWTVGLLSGNHCFRFSAGWKRFVEDNVLEVDDVCKFELINRITQTYMVHIFRHD